MSITLQAGDHAGSHTAGGHVGPASATGAATDGQPVGRRLAAVQLAAVDAQQRAHLSFALSPEAPDGEHLVRRSVELLAPYGWRHLRMVTWRQATPGTVAHLLIGPGGVVVVDERLWTGPVHVEAGGVLRHSGYRCEREVAALADAVAALAALLPPHLRTAVTGVLCVTPRDLPAQEVGGVQLVGRLHLGGLIAGLEERLSVIEAHAVARALTVAFDGPGAPTPTPDSVPTQRPSPEAMHMPSEAPAPSAYFARAQAASAGSSDDGAGRGQSGMWRSAALRVTVAVLVGLLTYQNSQAITVAVAELLGEGGTSVVAEG